MKRGVALLERPARVERIEGAVAAPQPNYPMQGQSSTTGLGGGRYRADEEEPKPSLGTIFTKFFPWIGWAVAAGLAITAGNIYHEREAQRVKLAMQTGEIDRLTSDAAGAKQLLETMTDSSARQVTLSRAATPVAPPPPQGRVTYVADKGALILRGKQPRASCRHTRPKELWLIPAGWPGPHPSAGTFHPDTAGQRQCVVLPPLPKGIEAKAFGVTIEDDGGSQTPTMPIVLGRKLTSTILVLNLMLNMLGKLCADHYALTL